MKKLQFTGICFSIKVPKGRSITELAEKDIKRGIRVRRVFSPRFANNIFAGKQKAH